MSSKVPAIATALAICTVGVAVFAQSSSSNNSSPSSRVRYLPEYTASGELVLPKAYRQWIYVVHP